MDFESHMSGIATRGGSLSMNVNLQASISTQNPESEPTNTCMH